MKRLELKIPPPLIGLAVAALMWFVARELPALRYTFSFQTALAITLAVIGLLLDVSGVAGFLRAKTTVNPLKPAAASTLVTTGVYRFTRNPMYAGMLLLLLAWAVRLGNAAALAGPPLFMLYIYRFQIAPEERVLTTLFGEQYAAYRLRVRRWL